nr:mycothiol synthase [Nocardioides daedukensis]
MLVTEWTPSVAAAVEQIASDCQTVDGVNPLDEAAQLRLRHHGLSGSRLWLHENGFALLHEGDVVLAVSYWKRGEGIGSLLAAEAVEGGATSAWSHADHIAARKIAERLGFERTRELWVMRWPLTPFAEPAPAAPEGVTVRSFRLGDEAELLRVNAAAFAAHPEQGAMDAANLAERMAEPWFSPEGLFLAVEDGDGAEQVLGFHWTKVHSATTGEVYVVGIDPSAQGRGIGKLLTRVGLDHLASVVSDEVILYVESDNLAARAVYEGLGFTHESYDTHVHYTK